MQGPTALRGWSLCGGCLGLDVLHLLFLVSVLATGFCEKRKHYFASSQKPFPPTFRLHVRSPECQVVPKQLHDQSRILVAFLRECVELGNGIVKGGLCQATSAIRGVEDFVVKYREVEGQTKPRSINFN